MTGKSIPVNTTVLMQYVIDSLRKYHEYIEATGEEPDINPYSTPLVYRLEDGRAIEIPDKVKEEAIKVWQSQDAQFEDVDEYPEEVADVGRSKVVYVKERSSNMMYILLILVVLAFAYYVYKNNKN